MKDYRAAYLFGDSMFWLVCCCCLVVKALVVSHQSGKNVELDLLLFLFYITVSWVSSGFWSELVFGFVFQSHVRWEKVKSNTFLAAQQQKAWKCPRVGFTLWLRLTNSRPSLYSSTLIWHLLRSMFSVFCVFITSNRRFSKGTFIVYMNVAASFFFFFYEEDLIGLFLVGWA